MHFNFFFPVCPVRTPTTMLNSSGKSSHPCLVPDFRREVLGLSLLSMMLSVGFHTLYQVDEVLLYS